MTIQTSTRIKMVEMKDVPAGAPILIHGTNERARALRRRIEAKRPDLSITGFVDVDAGPDIDETRVYGFDGCHDIQHCLAITNQTNWIQTAWRCVAAGLGCLYVLPIFTPSLSQRNCIVIHQSRAIYVPIYKAAYSSFTEMCRMSFAEFADIPRGTSLNSYVNLRDEKYKDYFKFSVVRNPISRALSCFNDKYNRPDHEVNAQNWRNPLLTLLRIDELNLADWLEFIAAVPDSYSDMHWRSQYSSLYDGPECLVDVVYRLEEMTSRFPEIKERAGIKVDLEHVNRAPKRSVNLDVPVELVRQRYCQDFEYFGYA